MVSAKDPKTGRVPMSVWEFPAGELEEASPDELRDLVDDLWKLDEDAKGLAFDIAQGLYWHCADCHGGQWSERYRILCSLEYSPESNESGPDCEASQYVYDSLDQQMR